MKHLFFILPLLLCNSGFSKTTSQVLFVPNGGASALTLNYGMGQMSYTTTATPSAKLDYTSSILSADYMWGVDDEMSVGASINSGNTKGEYKTSTSKLTSESSGLSDLQLKLRMNQMSWLYGIDLGLPLSVETTDASNVSNRSSGGMSLKPIVGMIFTNDSLNFGGHISYNYLLDRKHETISTAGSTSTSTQSGGSSLLITPFVEWNYGSGLISGEFTVVSASDTTTTSSSGMKSTDKADNHNVLALHGSYDFNPSITGLAGYSLAMFPSESTQSRPATNATNIEIGVRFLF
jgi:hypothetical protein